MSFADISHPFDEVRRYVDATLNKDKESFKTSNDEPTPIGCIEEILDHVPVSFWGEHRRILDPCCGNGNWHLVALDRIRKERPNESDSNILSQFHFNDTNQVRMDNVRTLFMADRNALNITQYDFLASSFDDQSYDMIFANPPYAKLMADGKRASKNHTMTRDFLRKSMDLLNEGGYLIYIIPDNWMSCADRNDVPRILTQYQFLHLNIHGAKKWFPKIGSSFTWFILQKQSPSVPMAVHNHYNKVNRMDVATCIPRSYVPLIYNQTIQDILGKTLDNRSHAKYKVETSSDLHKYTKRTLLSVTQDAEHPWRLIHTPKQTVYSERPHKFQQGPKVFISTTDRYSTFVDACGMTQSIAFIRCDTLEEAESIQTTLMHPLYVFLNNLCRWGNFNNIRILQMFPMPADTEAVYESFNITHAEKEHIEAITTQMRWGRRAPLT